MTFVATLAAHAVFTLHAGTLEATVGLGVEHLLLFGRERGVEGLDRVMRLVITASLGRGIFSRRCGVVSGPVFWALPMRGVGAVPAT
jgi:hypothetical protein